VLKKHPPGLAFVFFTEMWERVGFYTLMAILVLYMDKVLGWPDSKNSYNISFWICAGGLVLAIIIFQSGRKHLAGAGQKPFAGRDAPRDSAAEKPALSAGEGQQRIMALVTLFLIVIFFWVAFYQNGFALTLFAERSTKVISLLRPETYQFFEPFFILALTPLLLWLFSFLNRRGREPSTPAKIFWGMLFMSGSMIVTIAEILISPMGQSYVSKVAPPGRQGLEIDALARQILKAAGYDEFPHALGHQVGRFPHDGTALLGPPWEKYAQKPFQRLEEGMVFTIEPRLTVPGRGVVTVEEMVVVSKDGAEWLSRPQKELLLIR